MGQVATMAVRISADINDFEKNVSKAEKQFLKSSKAITEAGESLSLKMTAPFLAITGAMAEMASKSEASMARFGRVFGPATDQMNAFSKQLMKVVPESNEVIHQLLGTTEQFVEQLGLAPAKAVRVTQALTKLGADLAAFNHVSIDDAMGALDKALAGKTKGLISLGIVIDAQMVKQEAYRLGLIKVGDALTQSARAEATLALIQEKSSKITGEAARTADDAAKAHQFLKQATEELMDEWGKSLVPILGNVVHGLTDLTHWLTNVPTSVKLVTLSFGGLLALSGPTLIMVGSLIRNFTELSRVIRMLTGAEGLLGLVAGGGVVAAVVLGLAAIGVAIYESGEDARQAKEQVDSYKDALVGLSGVQLGQKWLQAQTTLGMSAAALAAAKSAPAPMRLANAKTGGRIADTAAKQNAIDAAQRQYDVAKAEADAATKAYNDNIRLSTAKGLGGFDTESKPDKSPIKLPEVADAAALGMQAMDLVARKLNLTIEAATENATDLAKAFGASDTPLADMQRFLEDAKALEAKALQTLQRFPDPLAQAHVEALKLLDTLQPILAEGALLGAFSSHGIYGVDPQDVVNRNGGFGASGTGAGGVADANVGLIPPKLDKLHEAFTAGVQALQNTFAQVGVGIAQALGARIAGNSTGGQIGGLLGAAAGGGLAAGLVKGGTGALLGGTVGSVVPVVGTILGTIAGSAIGGLIGGLFSHHTKAVDNSANALDNLAQITQSVAESLSNVPQGFKVALYRFEASAPTPIASYGANTGASGPAIYIEQADFHGVQDVSDLYDQLADVATIKGNRGGTQRLSSALAA